MFDTASDLAVSRGYSLRRSTHEALRIIATHEGHNNATRVLAALVEEYLRSEFGRRWTPESIEEQLRRERDAA